jgi:S-adenosylmethionine hydrolase
MNIITLTTDWGIADNYSAIFKAHLLREDAALQIIDITHQVPPNNIANAAFLTKTAYHYFPKNSVHIVDVSRQHQQNEQKYRTAVQNGTEHTEDFPFLDYLAFQYNDHYLLCENNGIVSYLCDKFDIAEVVKLPVDKRYADFATFKAIPHCVKAAADLAKGIPLKKIGKKYDINRIETIPKTPPHVSKESDCDIIAFNAQHIDSYGNIITNLDKKLFNEVADGRTQFEFYHSSLGTYKKQKISASYNETSQSSVLFLFGHSQFLEIWTKYAPFHKLLLEHNASHNMLNWKFTIQFKKD